MWAAAAAVVSAAAVVAALGALVVLAAGPVVLVVPVRRLVQVDPLRALVVLAVLVVLVHRLVRADRHPLRAPAAPLLAQLPALVHGVVEPAAAVELLLSRQSSLAAMARSTT